VTSSPLAVGLKGARRADSVSIDWSDSVFQSELDVSTDRLQQISETQRQPSSCPVLFAWLAAVLRIGNARRGKDMDLFTLDGETVGPLSSTGKLEAARNSLHARYKTRYQSGY